MSMSFHSIVERPQQINYLLGNFLKLSISHHHRNDKKTTKGSRRSSTETNGSNATRHWERKIKMNQWSKYVIANHYPPSFPFFSTTNWLQLLLEQKANKRSKKEKDFNMKNCHIRSLFLRILQHKKND